MEMDAMWDELVDDDEFAELLVLNLAKETNQHHPPPATLTAPTASTRKFGGMDDQKLLAPFELGWVREVVYRNNKKNRADIYYRSPSNEKARTPSDLLSKNLLSGGLTIENFSFAGFPIGVNDPAKEVVRRATEQKQPRQSPSQTSKSERSLVTVKREAPTKSLPADFRDLLAPFRFGWRRELVQRNSSHGNKQLDVYYTSPCGKKARSRIDVQKLIGPELSKDNFTFVPKPLGGGDKEVYRYASVKRRDPPAEDRRNDYTNGHCSIPPFPIENGSLDYQCPTSSLQYSLPPSNPVTSRIPPLPASNYEESHNLTSPFAAPVKVARIDSDHYSKTDIVCPDQAGTNGYSDELLERCKLATVVVQRCKTELPNNRSCNSKNSPRQRLKVTARKTQSCGLHKLNKVKILDSGLTRRNTHQQLPIRSQSFHLDSTDYSLARNTEVWKDQRIKNRKKIELSKALKLSILHPKNLSEKLLTNRLSYPQTSFLKSIVSMPVKSNGKPSVETLHHNNQIPCHMKYAERSNLGSQMEQTQSSSEPAAEKLSSCKISVEVKETDFEVAQKSIDCVSSYTKCNTTSVRAERSRSASKSVEPSIDKMDTSHDRASKDDRLDANVVKDNSLRPEPSLAFTPKNCSAIDNLSTTTTCSQLLVPSQIFKMCTAKRPLGRPRKSSIPINLFNQPAFPLNSEKIVTNIERNCPKKRGRPRKSSGLISDPDKSAKSAGSLMIPNPHFIRGSQQLGSNKSIKTSNNKPNDYLVPSKMKESLLSSMLLLYEQYDRMDNSTSLIPLSMKVNGCSLLTSKKIPHKGLLEIDSDVSLRPRVRPRKSDELMNGTPQELQSSRKPITKVSGTGSMDCRLPVKNEDASRQTFTPLAAIQISNKQPNKMRGLTSADPIPNQDYSTVDSGSCMSSISPPAKTASKKSVEGPCELGPMPGKNAPKKPRGRPRKSAKVISQIEKCDIKAGRSEPSLMEPIAPLTGLDQTLVQEPSSVIAHKRCVRAVKVERDYFENRNSSPDSKSSFISSSDDDFDSSKRNCATLPSSNKSCSSTDHRTERILPNTPKRKRSREKKLVFFGPKNRPGRPRKFRLLTDEINHSCSSFSSQLDIEQKLNDVPVEPPRGKNAPECQEMAVQTDDVSFSFGNFFILPGF